MASRPDSTAASGIHKARRATPAGRISVYQLFLHHASVLAKLPGEVSQFDETGFGYEWRCEYRLGEGAPAGEGHSGGYTLKLHFSLVDMKGRMRPVAVLYVVEQGSGQSSQARQLLPLEDLAETHEVLNDHLARKQVSIDALEKASRFITALYGVRDAIGLEVDWASN